MKVKHLKAFIITMLATGCGLFVFLMLMPIDPTRGKLVNYAVIHGIMTGLQLLLLLFFGSVLYRLYRKPAWAEKIRNTTHNWMTQPAKRLFYVQFFLISAMIFSIEGFLLTFFVLPEPARPLILWMGSAFFVVWLFLRVVYANSYKQRLTILKRIKRRWHSWSQVQRRTFLVLVVLGTIAFLIYFPINYGGRIHPDEDVIYPDVINMLIPGETFYDTLRDTFIIDSWWYGYPYFPLCALTLVIPRLLFGTAFAEKVPLNLLIMRQFISVLPMILSLIWLIYLVNAFKSMWKSVGMFVVLMLIPGVVRYNTRFWHPDGIIVLLIVLTFWLLKRDKLRFGVNFYLAAAAVGLNAAIKVWGLFFFLAIGGYLLAGMIEKKLTIWGALRAGGLFILVMAATIVITMPSILIPWNLKTYIAEMNEYYPVMRYGYDEPDPQGVYRTGLAAWMVFFRIHYMQDFFFYFSVFATLAGSLLGTSKTLNRIILAWCGVIGVYLVNWIAVKSFQYMLPLMIPLYASAFMFPHIAGGSGYPKALGFLANTKTKTYLQMIVIVLVLIQVYFNIKMIPISLRY